MKISAEGNQAYTEGNNTKNSAQTGSSEGVFNGFGVSSEPKDAKYVSSDNGSAYTKNDQMIHQRSISTLIRQAFQYLTSYFNTHSMAGHIKDHLVSANQQLVQGQPEQALKTLTYAHSLMTSTRTGINTRSSLSESFNSLLVNNVFQMMETWIQRLDEAGLSREDAEKFMDTNLCLSENPRKPPTISGNQKLRGSVTFAQA